MADLVLLAAARADLKSIWRYTAKTWDTEQAELYTRQIIMACEKIAADPDKGRSCDNLRLGYRKFAVNLHMIFYRMQSNQIVEVVRILHQSMDFNQHLQ